MRYDFKTLISIITIISFLYPAPVLAKITPKTTDKKVEVITIKKGDTLWDLAKLYYKDPFMWKKFQEFNIITNPDLIFPGEKLVISAEDAKKLKEILEKRTIEVKEEIKQAEAKKKLLEKKKEEPEKVEKKEEVVVKEIKVPVPDEECQKKVAKLEREIKILREEKSRLEKEDEEIDKLTDQITCLKEEEKMLQMSKVELEEKLAEEKIMMTTVKKQKEEAEGYRDFLSIGAICGFIMMFAFK